MKEAVDTKIPLHTNTVRALDPSMTLDDIMVKAYIEDRLSFDASQTSKKVVNHILLWI